MECRAGEIERFHGLLNAAIRGCIYGDTVINQRPDYRATSAWKKPGFHGELGFDLWSEPMAGQVFSDDRRPVHQLRDVEVNDSLGWVAWHDSWIRPKPTENFAMVASSLTFYWGPRTRLDKIFRAEWSADGIAEAAHPHWHADCTVIGSDLGISRLHFGMGGWRHAGHETACWQLRPLNPDEVREWAVKTMEYCRQQLMHYPPSPGNT